MDEFIVAEGVEEDPRFADFKASNKVLYEAICDLVLAVSEMPTTREVDTEAEELGRRILGQWAELAEQRRKSKEDGSYEEDEE